MSSLFKLWEKDRVARAAADLNDDDEATTGAEAMLSRYMETDATAYPFAPAGFAKGDRLCHVPDCTIPPTDDACEAHR